VTELYNLPLLSLLCEPKVPDPVHLMMIIGDLLEVEVVMCAARMQSNRLKELRTFTLLMPTCISSSSSRGEAAFMKE
jgi:hypothetical protein